MKFYFYLSKRQIKYTIAHLFALFCFSSLISQNVEPVIPSQVGGKYADSITIELNCSTLGADIRYTIDGSVPTKNSIPYTTPLKFVGNTPLRARAFLSPLLPSKIMTHTYFFNLNHSFPVVSVVFEPADFFDPATGIYPNFTTDLTTRANIEFFETNSTAAAFNQYVETEIQGTTSAFNDQKSLDIKPKASLGGATVDYKIFPDLPYEKYKRFVLRNGGQDWNIMMFRDEFVGSLVGNIQNIDGILEKPSLDLQAARPAVVYYNGQYWGIHNIRERMNKNYVEQHYNLAANSYDMLENYSEVLAGDTIAWFLFEGFLRNNNFEDTTLFYQLRQQIDYQNYLDYCILNIYIDNQDWPGNNVRKFRERKPDGKWRWISYDFDFTFGLFQEGAWNTGDPSPDALARILNPDSFTWPNPDWATLLFRKCWGNAQFRQDFANRTADFMNTIFKPSHISARLDEFKNQYQPEIEQHFIRWTNGYYAPFWLENIEKTRKFSNVRPQYMRQYMDAALPEVLGTTSLTLNASPLAGGNIRVSSITIGEMQYPWRGDYFTGIKIPIKAIANPGYVFVGWSEPNLGTSDSIFVTLHVAKSLTAKFSVINPVNPVAPTIACTPNSLNPWIEYIKTVKINTYTRESGKETYTNVAGIATTLSAGNSYPITLTTGFSFETFDEYWRVWIDYNRDGIFSDAEIAFQSISYKPPFGVNATKSVNGFITIPAGTALGNANLRVGMKRAAYPSPCDTVAYGEFEDYSISIDNSGVINPPSPPVADCVSKSEFPWSDWISSIKVNTFINNSQKDQYSNFTNLVASADIGKNVQVSLKTSFSFETFSEFWKIWIDWNQDGSLNDTNETAFQSIALAPDLGTEYKETMGSFIVPTTALLGRTKMRISMKRGSFPSPCEIFTFGEVEDYTILINSDSNMMDTDIDNSLQSGDSISIQPNENDLADFIVFPNPANDKVTINLKSLKNTAVKIQLSNVYGTLVKDWNVPILQNALLELDVNEIEIGTYFLRVVFENGRSIGKKLVVMKED
jgi:uncharacterized repeat protein (TIGR02543 family)